MRTFEFPERAGFIIESPGYWGDKSAGDNLRYLAKLQGIKDKEVVDRLLKTVGLENVGRKKVKKFSMGMKQRLGIAQALLGDPDLFVLDEPMNGLDKSGVAEMRRLLLNLKGQGKTLILTSHNKEDIEILCDVVYEMDDGILTLL